MEYAYSDDGDLVELRHVFANANTVTFSYAYNGVGQLTAETASQTGWLYNPASTATTTYGAVNAHNQLSSYTTGGVTTPLFYDDLDNVTGDGTYYWPHDSQNRLTGAAGPGVNESYIYGPAGRRVAVVSAYNGITLFVHAGTMEIAEYDTSGNILRRYVPGPGVDQRVAMINTTPSTCSGGAVCQSQARYFYHTNRLGSVIALTDDNGVIVDQYRYTPYGVEDVAAT